MHFTYHVTYGNRNGKEYNGWTTITKEEAQEIVKRFFTKPTDQLVNATISAAERGDIMILTSPNNAGKAMLMAKINKTS